MALYDTIKFGATERTFAGWGLALDGVRTLRRNLDADSFVFDIPTANITDDPIFPYEAFIIVQTNRVSTDGSDNSFSGGTIKFQGYRFKNPLKSNGQQVGVSYEFHSPWYYLDITQYLQTYKGATTNYNPGEVVLNTAAYPQISTGGLRFISVGDQIQCILQFVLDACAAMSISAPFQYVGRDLNAGAIDLDVSGTGPVGENTDAGGNVYVKSVNVASTIDAALFKLFLPSEIVRPASAAEFIQKLLQASPRTCMEFDYTTTPPTIHFGNVDNGADQNLALFDGANNKSISLLKREDLIPASVVIGYVIRNTIGGVVQTDYAPDKYGPHGSNNALDPDSGPGVIAQTIDLQGLTQVFTNGFLDCEPLAFIGGTQATKRAWWSSRRGGGQGKLADTRVRFQNATGAATTLPDAKIYYASAGVDSTGAAVAKDQEFTAADYAYFLQRIVRGTHHAWMTYGGSPVKSVKAYIICAGVQYAEYDATSTSGTPDTDLTGNQPRGVTADLHADVELTNAPSGLNAFSTLSSSTPGESYIIGAGGIAQYIYSMLSTPQFDGEFIKVEQVWGSAISMLNRVNFTGGRADWTTMHAQIQEIEEDWGRKYTYIRIGVSKLLTASQLSAFLNMWRFRRAWYNPLVKADNTVGASGEVDMPTTAGSANSPEGLENTNAQEQIYYTTPPAGSTPGTFGGLINHAPKKINDILAATTPTPVAPFVAADLKIMQPRECQFCDETGAVMNGIIHTTGFYTKP